MAATDDIKPGLPPSGEIAWEAVLHVPTKPGFGSLERFYDGGLRIGVETTATQLAGAEVERIAHSLAVVLAAGLIPRRLGGDAASQDLAIDRKRSKRVAHVLSQSLNAWSIKPRAELDEEIIRREGAQLDWSEFAAEERTQIQTSLRVVATWAIRNDELRWGRSAVVNLTNELAWMRYALRD